MVSEVVQYYITGCKRTMKAQVDSASSGPNTPTRGAGDACRLQRASHRTDLCLHYTPFCLAAPWTYLRGLWVPSWAAWLPPALSKRPLAVERVERRYTAWCSSGGGAALQAGAGKAATGACTALRAIRRCAR